MEEIKRLLERLSKKAGRPYSTADFGRTKNDQCLSVIVPSEQARSLVAALRTKLPPDFVAFMGTTNWLGDEKHDGAEVVVGKGASQFDILRLAKTDACNYNMYTEDIIKKLEEWDQACGIDIFHAETDTVELEIENLPDDLEAFANDVYKFCPDIVDQGVGSVEALKESMEIVGQLFLWWD